MARTSRSPTACAALALGGGLGLLCQGPLRAFVGLARTIRPDFSSSRNVRVAMSGKAKDGIFTPVVTGAKAVLGESELKALRSKVIKAHGEVMGKFIDTSDTRIGVFALRQLFKAADKDGTGSVYPEGLKAVLNALGFSWVDDKKAETLTKKGKSDDNSIDFEEFRRMAPTMLRQNLMKLAKEKA